MHNAILDNDRSEWIYRNEASAPPGQSFAGPAEAASALGDDVQTLARLHPAEEKRARAVVDGSRQDPLPLGRLYVLADGTAPEIEPLKPRDAFVEVVRHSYLDRLLQATGTTASHFRQCGALVTRVPVRRLTRPRVLHELPALAHLIENDVVGLDS